MIVLVSTEFSIFAALYVPFRQFAILCTCHSGRWSARNILYLVRTLFHCFQYTARILCRSHSSVVSISPFMSAYDISLRYSLLNFNDYGSVCLVAPHTDISACAIYFYLAIVLTAFRKKNDWIICP